LDLFLELEESALEEHFVDCGHVVAVRIVRDPVTGVGKGFGYVLFEVRDTSACDSPWKCPRRGFPCVSLSSFRHNLLSPSEYD
jgi:hypothetical protein